MDHRERMRLDEHIAGGHYGSNNVRVRCSKCREFNSVLAWSEYGTGGYEPEECPFCGEPYGVDNEWDCDVPDVD